MQHVAEMQEVPRIYKPHNKKEGTTQEFSICSCVYRDANLAKYDQCDVIKYLNGTKLPMNIRRETCNHVGSCNNNVTTLMDSELAEQGMNDSKYDTFLSLSLYLLIILSQMRR